MVLSLHRPLTLTLLCVLAWAACGRSSLDSPIGTAGVGGRGGANGVAGTSGSAGTFGFAGTSGSAGTFGFAGTSGSAGTFGPGFDCIDGTSECEGTTNVRFCTGGQWGFPIACPTACTKGVCTECLPGTTNCLSTTSVAVCDANGIWSAPRPAGVECGGGACKPGETRCASPESVQTCTSAGQWGPASSCVFVCVNGACGTNDKVVFVSSLTFQGGGLGGLEGADAICNKLAASANLPGFFRAWLSDAKESPAIRFDRDGGPYKLVNGLLVARNWSELVGAGPLRPIALTEVSSAPPTADGFCEGSAVWSATAPNGTPLTGFGDVTCDGWTNPTAPGAAWGLIGANQGSNLGWSHFCVNALGPFTSTCASSAALYCFQQ